MTRDLPEPWSARLRVKRGAPDTRLSFNTLLHTCLRPILGFLGSILERVGCYLQQARHWLLCQQEVGECR